MALEQITGKIIDAAMRVHTALGPGLLESAYEACLLFELHRRGVQAVRQVELPVVYENVRIDAGYRIDLVHLKDGIKRMVNGWTTARTGSNTDQNALFSFLPCTSNRPSFGFVQRMPSRPHQTDRRLGDHLFSGGDSAVNCR